MTRLINADALMEKSFEIEYADGWHKSVTKEVVSVKDINNAPTIELSGDIISKAEVLALINKAMYNTDNKEIQDYLFCGLRRDVHNLPTTGSSDDLISRQDAIEVVRSAISEKWLLREAIIIDIETLPSVDRPKGEWLDGYGNKVEIDDNGITEGSCWCSVCGEWLVASDEYSTKGYFCPNCGADMRGGAK